MAPEPARYEIAATLQTSGLSEREIAAQMGIGVGSVRAHLRKAEYWKRLEAQRRKSALTKGLHVLAKAQISAEQADRMTDQELLAVSRFGPLALEEFRKSRGA